MQIDAAMVCSTLGGRKQCCTGHEPLHSSTSHELSSTTWTRRLAVPRTPRQSPPPPPRPRHLARAFGALAARAKGFDSGKPPQRYQLQTPGTQRRTLSPTTQAPKGGSQRVFPTGPRSRLRQEPGLPEPRCERPGPSETSQRRPRSPRNLNLPWHLSNSRFQRPPAGLCSEETPIAKAPFLPHLASRLTRLETAQSNPPKTSPPQKQKALWPTNVAKPPSSLSSRCDKHPTKWRQRRLLTTPKEASSATYAARTRLRDRGSRAPAAPRKGRGFYDGPGRAPPSTLRLRAPAGPARRPGAGVVEGTLELVFAGAESG